MCLLGAMGLESSDQSWRDSQDREVQFLGYLPQTVRPRVIGGTVIGGDRRAVGQARHDHPRSHDPSHVGRPHENVVSAHIELEGAFLSDLDREAGLDVHRPLGSPCRSRCVCDQYRVFGIRPDRWRGGCIRDRPTPPHVSTRGHRRGASVHVVDDHDTVDPASSLDGAIGDLFHLDEPSPPLEAVGTQEHLGLRVLEPGRNGLDPIPAEDRDEDRSQAADGQKGDDRLLGHREVDGDSVTVADSELGERTGSPRYLIEQLPEGELTYITGFLHRSDS